MLPDGGLVYFIGLVSDTPFSAAQIRFNPESVGTFLYNVDDITTAPIPEPGASLLFCAGALVVGRALRARTRQPDC